MKYFPFTVKLREHKYGFIKNHEKDDTEERQDEERKPVLPNSNGRYVFRRFYFENKSHDTVVKIVVGSFLLL